MSFNITTDTTSNLTTLIAKKYGIMLVPLTYIINGEEKACTDLAEFDADDYYNRLKDCDVKTSTANIHQYTEIWRGILEGGNDILHLALSSGISGAYQTACRAADILREEFPDRKITVFDTLGASLGEGLQVIRAAKLRASGKTMNEVVNELVIKREKNVQIFSVDNLEFLRRGGRISAAVAKIGTVLRLKPILKANYCGEIILDKKVRGRKSALQSLVDDFAAHFNKDSKEAVGVAYAGCKEDAGFIVELLRKIAPAAEFLVTKFEPVTGSHVGPGTIALFYTRA